MIRATVLTLALTALPGVAAAQCGSMQGSFAVSCESGVKVYRHDAASSIPRGPSASQLRLEAAKLKQQTARERIAAQRATAVEQAELRRAEITQDAYRNSLYERRSRTRIRTYGYGGYYGGYQLARPLTVRNIN